MEAKVASSKQRLSQMLEVDLSKPESMEDAAEGGEVEGPGRPTTLAEWLSSATAEELKAQLLSLKEKVPGADAAIAKALEEERAFQASVEKQEQEWQESQKKKNLTAEAKAEERAAAAAGDEDELEIGELRFIPLRLTGAERGLLQILQGALYVSEYTDEVDVYHVGNKSRRMALQIQQLCAIVAGLVVSNNFDVARKPLMEKAFADNAPFFRACFEIGRRYKILNPDRLRGSYGKLIHMLQDSVKDEVVRAIDMECVAPLRTVFSFLQHKRRAGEFLKDPLLSVATREVYVGTKTRDEVSHEVREKSEAVKELKSKYAEKLPDDAKPLKEVGDLAELLRGRQQNVDFLTAACIDTTIASISDHYSFQRYNREPVERMLEYLRTCFNPASEGKWSLEISRGRGGSMLSHSHRTQFTFVFQSLLLWREIMGNMFALWQMTEDDLLNPNMRYRLCDTGQGLNRVQSAPRVQKMMSHILHRVQSEVGGWVGLSVVHLGDRDVPNALVFIDKYTQVPRILGPLVKTLDRIPDLYASSPAMKAYIDAEFGNAETLRMMILQDFFKHGFDGSGDDGGSCIDGRLTSCWNWCSKIEKKKYHNGFVLTGFIGFDGENNGSGWVM